MQRSISPEDLRILHHEADVAARRLQRQYRLSRDDLDDLRQELAGRSDRPVGGIRSAARFPRHLCRHRDGEPGHANCASASCVTAACTAPRRSRSTKFCPTVRAPPGVSWFRKSRVLAAVQGHWINPVTEVERRIDLERGLGALDAQGRRLAANLLSAGTPHQLAKRGRDSRSELYRQTRELRLTLMSVGIKAA